MATVSGTTTTPSTHSMGCCERFTHFLYEIKSVALRFFQWLFCCQSATPKPLPPTQVLGSKDVEKVTQNPKLTSLLSQSSASSSNSSSSSTSSTSTDTLPQSSNFSSSSTSSTSTDTSVKTPRRPDEGAAFVDGYCIALGKVKQDQRVAVFQGTGIFLLRCLSATDQLWMLQKCSECLVIADWTDFIQALPEHIKNQIDPHNPEFHKLYAKQLTVATQLPSAEKLFLHQMLHNIFLPLEQRTQKHFSIEDVEKFQSFRKAEQFFILYTLFVIGMNDKKLHTNLNYTEIGKLLHHSLVKEEIYDQMIKQKMEINGIRVQDLKTLYNALSKGLSITSWEELSCYFAFMKNINDAIHTNPSRLKFYLED